MALLSFLKVFIGESSGLHSSDATPPQAGRPHAVVVWEPGLAYWVSLRPPDWPCYVFL